ncbi:hypothetical protein D3C81_1623490 [compost metagenome]
MNFLKIRTTTHPTKPARLGRPVDWETMEALIDTHGTVEVQTVSTDWAAPLSGLLNLKDPKAVAASLQNRIEPSKIYSTLFAILREVSSSWIRESASALLKIQVKLVLAGYLENMVVFKI